jgi:hypothetical protein
LRVYALGFRVWGLDLMLGPYGYGSRVKNTLLGDGGLARGMGFKFHDLGFKV